MKKNDKFYFLKRKIRFDARASDMRRLPLEYVGTTFYEHLHPLLRHLPTAPHFHGQESVVMSFAVASMLLFNLLFSPHPTNY
jgi:hypothetical protein